MPLFISDEEFRLLANDGEALAKRADAAIIDLRRQLDTVRAEADASSISAEQACAILEQRFSSLSADFSRVQSDNSQLAASLEQRTSELASSQSEKHITHLKVIEKDGEIQRLTVEASESHKSKRQILELLEQKDAEISEKNALVKSYLDKIVNLTYRMNEKEARVLSYEAEMARCRATCDRLTQEKQLVEKHNIWLNEELTAKVSSLVELRKTHMEVEEDHTCKISDLQRRLNEFASLYKSSKDRVSELEKRASSLEEELKSSSADAATNEERFTTAIATVSKLVELYKASSEEWSKKAGELEGVIKALETHLSQVDNDYKEKLEKEESHRTDNEKVVLDLKQKLEKCEAELENTRKASDFSIVPFPGCQTSLNAEVLLDEAAVHSLNGDHDIISPRFPIGISGTALAASLIRDGWTLAKIYAKYQEAADALRHEKWGRRHSESMLKRILHEIEEKAELILDERAEHERMMEAYNLMNHNLQQALLQHESFQTTIRNLEADLKGRDREYIAMQKDTEDLQKQVVFLLKECQDIQIRCGVARMEKASNSTKSINNCDATSTDEDISQHPSSFKDINALVKQNVQLRSILRSLSDQEEKNSSELKKNLQIEYQKISDEAATQVEAVLKRSEDQRRMIESLHSSVAMYKRLYEEEKRNRSPSSLSVDVGAEGGNNEIAALYESSQAFSRKAYSQLSERAQKLEEELAMLRSELASVRVERDKHSLEAKFARERLDSFLKEAEVQRHEANAISSRNLELSNLIIDYQRRVRESSDSLQTVEDKLRQQSIEISVLSHKKEILEDSEKKASDEVRNLTERVYRLQSTIDTIQSSDEVRENARAVERRSMEEHLNRINMDWAEAKKDLQDEKDRVRTLTLHRERDLENSNKQLDDLKNEVADAWRAVASAESRAAVAEARCSELEKKITQFEKKVIGDHGSGFAVLSSEEVEESLKAKEMVEKLIEEVQANKDYMQQYKEIAHTNEVALKQIESAHEEYKSEAERLKMVLEAENQSLLNRISELDKLYLLKSEEASSTIEATEKALTTSMSQSSALREEITGQMRKIAELETQVSCLKDDLDREHKHWRTAQDNYERQVILQSETIHELTNSSKELSGLQVEVSKLRELTEKLKSENEFLKETREKEKSELVKAKDDAERNHSEINEQNRILHNRLEALHIKLAEKEQGYSGLPVQRGDSHEDHGFQNVVNYLRHSKEIAETEISLLKQEKLRLQLQLEHALKASERAQELLVSHQESTTKLALNEEQFKSLQLQVREITLLRESNLQLREENKHNFEEWQRLRKESQQMKSEAENTNKLLIEKQIDLEAFHKMVEMKDIEIAQLNSRLAELVERYKNLSLEDYEGMKSELQNIKEQQNESEMHYHLAKNIASEKQEIILKLEENLAKCQSELAGQMKKLNDTLQVEAENDKLKKILLHTKKKNENLMKEKEELNKQNQLLDKDVQGFQRQIEDLKTSGKRMLDENSDDQAMQEKDKRIQSLEKAIEKERQSLEKERTRRKASEDKVLELVNVVNKDKKKVEEELKKHWSDINDILLNNGLQESQIPSSTLNETTAMYMESVDSFLCVASPTQNVLGTLDAPGDVSPVGITVSGAGGPVPSQQTRPPTPEIKGVDEREKRPAALKGDVEVRKPTRRLKRPHLGLPEETRGEILVSGTDSASADEVKTSLTHEAEAPDQLIPSRKRPSSSLGPELVENASNQDDCVSNRSPPIKRGKEFDSLQEFGGEQSILENPDSSQQLMLSLSDNAGTRPYSEDSESDRPSLPLEDIIDVAKEKQKLDASFVCEMEVQQLISPGDELKQEAEIVYESSSIEEFSGNLRPVSEINVDSVKVQGNDGLQPTVESPREEGEFMEDELEIPEDISPVELNTEAVTSEGIGLSSEVGEISEDTFSEMLDGKSEKYNVEEAGEVSERTESSTIYQGVEKIPQIPLVSQEESNPQRQLALRVEPASSNVSTPVTEQQISAAPSVTNENRTGRTISLIGRARENAQKREEERLRALQLSTRGRTRSGIYRDGGRGARGRGGRG